MERAECADCGASAERMPRVAATGGRRPGARPAVLAAGAIDATCEQMVAGADRDGDVLVLCGTTLIVWATIPNLRRCPGCGPFPHTAEGKCQIGGASNAGGLFLNWVDRLVGPGDSTAIDPGRVPVWAPYVRGERTPYHDPDRRATLDGLNLTHDRRVGAPRRLRGVRIRRASPSSWASSGLPHRGDRRGYPRRAVDAGHRRRDRPPVEVSAVPEAALGAAFLA